VPQRRKFPHPPRQDWQQEEEWVEDFAPEGFRKGREKMGPPHQHRGKKLSLHFQSG
jgi:hypothetical protein